MSVARALLPAKSNHEQGCVSRFGVETPRKSLNSSLRLAPRAYDGSRSNGSVALTKFRRYEYRRRLPHYQRDGQPLFVTFRTQVAFELSPPARTLALQHCLHDDGKTIQLHAVVVMPDHVHLLFTALRDAEGWTFALPEILRAIKGSSARSINKLTGRVGPVWQDESFDHVLRGDESLCETVEYIRQNPVRKGLADKPEDYRWLWVDCGVV